MVCPAQQRNLRDNDEDGPLELAGLGQTEGEDGGREV